MFRQSSHKYLFILIGALVLSSLLEAANHTVLLTGGAGFIGSHVAQALLERDDTVIIVDNFNDAYDQKIKRSNIDQIIKKNNKNSLKIYEIDVRDVDALDKVIVQESPDLICHLAARAGVLPSMKTPHEYISSNIIGTLNILECARRYNIAHVVMASSSSVYGDSSAAPFIEDQVIDKQCSPYGVTKRTGELLAYTYHYLYGISCTCLRFFTVYGPRGRVDMAPFKFMDAIYRGNAIQLCGDGSIVRDFTYVSDIVDGIIRSLDTPVDFAIVNLGRGEPITLGEFIQVIEQVVGKKAIVNHVPTFAADVTKTHADITLAKNLLGYEPRVSVAQGMQKMFEWYKQIYEPLKID